MATSQKDIAAAWKEYADFSIKVKRTIFLDNLSPTVTATVVKTALEQFGNVMSVQFIPNYLEVKSIPMSALVVLENTKQARSIVNEINSHPFMISGMPRPIRARLAQSEMFANRPTHPDKKIHCRWITSRESDFPAAKKLKHLVRKHTAEASVLLKYQLEEEEKLAKRQEEMLKSNYKKMEMVEKAVAEGIVYRLARRYGVKLVEDE